MRRHCRHRVSFSTVLSTMTMAETTSPILIPSAYVRTLDASSNAFSRTRCRDEHVAKGNRNRWATPSRSVCGLNDQWRCAGQQQQVYMFILVILGRKCTLATSRAAPSESCWVCATRCMTVRKKMGQTDRRTDGRQTVTLSLTVTLGQRNDGSQSFLWNCKIFSCNCCLWCLLQDHWNEVYISDVKFTVLMPCGRYVQVATLRWMLMSTVVALQRCRLITASPKSNE